MCIPYGTLSQIADELENIRKILERQSTIETTKKTAEWKYSYKENIAECGNCGNEHYLGTYRQFATNFCPKCGTKMSNSHDI